MRMNIICFFSIEVSPSPPVGSIRVEYRVTSPITIIRNNGIAKERVIHFLPFDEVESKFILYYIKIAYFFLMNAGTSSGSSASISSG